MFNGNCLEAFEFYKSVFKKDYEHSGTFADMPSQEGMPSIPDSEKDRVMHLSMPISKETVLMGSDTSSAWGPPPVAGTNFSISVSTDSREEADRIFAELSKNGQVTMPMDDTFWGSYFGSLTDRFGINWMVGYDAPAN
jgi:PhnB protein